MKAAILRYALAAALMFGATAQAQVFRAYLASGGNDANACSLVSPCRLLPRALAVVADGGEIWMLDSGNFNTGTVTIAKSVKILAVPGALGSLVASSNGHAILVTTSGLNIGLSNLSIGPMPGASPGISGVFLNGASNLTVENCLIANLPASALVIWGGGSLRVTGSILRDNGGVAVGLDGGANAVIQGTHMLGNASGGVAASSRLGATTVAAVSNSVISGGSYGVFTNVDNMNSVARISVTQSVIRHTFNAVRVASPFDNGNSRIDLGGSLVADNDWAWVVFGTGATFHSLGDNQIIGNGSVSGTRNVMLPE